MTQSKQAVSPLRQRMIDDLRMRKLSPKTQTHYLRIVRQFAGYLGRSPDTATVEELRRYQLHLVDQGIIADLTECRDHRAEVLLRGHARSCRVDGQDAAGACSAETTGGVEP